MYEWAGTDFRATSYKETFRLARAVAAALRARDVRAGDNVAQIITNGQRSLATVFGIWFAGATVASLPVIARGTSIDGYRAQLRRICANLNPRVVILDERFRASLDQNGALGPTVLTCEELTEETAAGPVSPPGLDDTLFIQFSSGTTAEPRGVCLTTRAIASHMELLTERLAIDPDRDVGGIWVPHSHDLGFFGGNMVSWYAGIGGVRTTPERFLSAPWTWLEDCARFGVTVTAVPPTALDLAVRANRTRPLRDALHIRCCLLGAEEVYHPSLVAAAETFGPLGLDLSALVPAYGLAEATLAVAVGSPGEEAIPLRRLIPDAGRNDRHLASCGRPLVDGSVRIDDETSEIIVTGPTLATGYHGAPGTGGFGDGEFRTGDVGRIHDGELFVTGRLDDRLIIGGRTIFARPLERALQEHPAIRTGNCAVVDVLGEAGRPVLVLVAEFVRDGALTPTVERDLRREAMRFDGVRLHDMIALPRGQFPKTPSGKPQRYRCRALASREAERTR